MSENDYPKGVEGFTEPERVFCEVMTNLARHHNTENNGVEAIAKLTELAASVHQSKGTDPNLCTDDVYSFCMAWLGGAITMAGCEAQRVAGGKLTMTHCGIAFASGAIITYLLTQYTF